MRVVAKYSFSARNGKSAPDRKSLEQISDLVERWLEDKGEREKVDDKVVIRFRSGKKATLTAEAYEIKEGFARRWLLTEPTRTGLFSTEIQVSADLKNLQVFSALRTGSKDTVVAPIDFEAHCPRIVRDIADIPLDWRAGNSVLGSVPERLIDVNGGSQLSERIQDPDRTLPLVVVSEHEGFPLHPSLAKDLARDLFGHANVIEVNPDASWRLTQLLGSEWSCFNAAVRLYWPFSSTKTDPFRHPLWTAQRLLSKYSSTEDAARILTRSLRRKLQEVSCFSVRLPRAFEAIKTRAEEEQRKAARQKALKEVDDLRQLQELFESELEKLENDLSVEREEKAALQDQVAFLEAKVENLSLAQEWAERTTTEDAPEPDEQTPPETLRDAIEQAKREFNNLWFSDDVEEGLESVTRQAGPPDKILAWLGKLNELAEKVRTNSVNDTLVGWLKKSNFESSGESETVRNNKAERRKRTWGSPDGRRFYELHMKPAEATKPDNCVRIYFQWDDDSDKMLVGWVGRHP